MQTTTPSQRGVKCFEQQWLQLILLECDDLEDIVSELRTSRLTQYAERVSRKVSIIKSAAKRIEEREARRAT